MKKISNHFYHSLVSMESLRVRLDLFGFSTGETERLLELAERTLHHSILDLVLSELSDSDKQLFLRLHASEDHEEVWKLLKGNVKNIEKKIKGTAETVSKKLHKDLKTIKK